MEGPNTFRQVALAGAEFDSKYFGRMLSKSSGVGNMLALAGLSAVAAGESVEELRTALVKGIQITTPKGDDRDAERIRMAEEKQAIKAEKRLRNAAKGAFQ